MVEKNENKIRVPNYEVIVSVKNGKYFCRIPELSMVGKGNDLESSYKELMNKKKEFVQDVEEFQVGDELPFPSTTRFRVGDGSQSYSSSGKNLIEFLAKVIIVSLLVLVVSIIGTKSIGGEINNIIATKWSKLDSKIVGLVENVRKEIEKSIPSHLGREIEKELYKAVDHPIDPEREKKIVSSIRVIVNRLKPFAREFRPLLEEIGLAKKMN